MNRNTFNQDRYYTPERFQHCPTLAPVKQGILTAFYAGYRECAPDQKVKLFFISEGHQSLIEELEENTGNPILLATGSNTASLIYSEFAKTGINPVSMWQWCKTWVREITVRTYQDGTALVNVGDRSQIFVEEPFDDNPPEGLGYLARCHPIAFEDGWLLPLYREHRPHFHGVVLYSEDGLNWEYRGTVGRGTPCIQPTIWEEDGVLHCLMRNFARREGQKAYYSQSTDGGATWSDLSDSQFYNYNNSILSLSCPDGKPLFVWNDDPTGRKNISLGSADRKIIMLDGYGSYPAACLQNGKIHVAYMAMANPLKTPHARTVIKHKTYDLNAVQREASKPIVWSGGPR